MKEATTFVIIERFDMGGNNLIYPSSKNPKKICVHESQSLIDR